MIELNFMTLNDYNDYIQKAILSYASELILSERFQSQEIAYQYALDEYQEIFKSGFKTPNIYLYNIVVDQQKVGIIKSYQIKIVLDIDKAEGIVLMKNQFHLCCLIILNKVRLMLIKLIFNKIGGVNLIILKEFKMVQ